MTTPTVFEEFARCHWAACPHGPDCVHAVPVEWVVPADPNCEMGWVCEDDGPNAW